MDLHINAGYPPVSSGPPVAWGDLVSHPHSVQFYEDDSFLLDELSRFIGAALGAGDAALVIATQAHCEELARLLTARGLNLARPIAQGRYVVLDAAETLAKFMRHGRPDPA